MKQSCGCQQVVLNKVIINKATSKQGETTWTNYKNDDIENKLESERVYFEDKELKRGGEERNGKSMQIHQEFFTINM